MQYISISAKWLGKSALRLLITMILVLLIAFLPSIYETVPNYPYRPGLELSFSHYFESIGRYFDQLLHGDLGTYTAGRVERKISVDMFRFLQTTATILGSAIFFGTIFGILTGFVAIWLKRKWREGIQFFSFFLISIPDFLVITILQGLVIWIYKKTGIKIFSIATAANQTAYFLPVLTLSLFPFAHVFRSTLHSFEEILSERYIQTAYAKGLVKFKVLKSHVFKNGLVSVLINMPSVLMLTLSNLVIVEFMFNTHGITMFVFTHQNNLNVLAISILLIWLMIELILLLNTLALNYLSRQKGD